MLASVSLFFLSMGRYHSRGRKKKKVQLTDKIRYLDTGIYLNGILQLCESASVGVLLKLHHITVLILLLIEFKRSLNLCNHRPLLPLFIYITFALSAQTYILHGRQIVIG